MSDMDDQTRRVLEANWSPEFSFSMPNAKKYPYQWLWDSCFHAISWSRIGDHRAVNEMEAVFRFQLRNGFVPNMSYQRHPHASTWMWSQRNRSDITQPPMFGHALRVLHDRGFDVRQLLAPATAGLDYLLTDRRDPVTGLVRIVHPWESGADDSPRWDSWMPGGRYNRKRWNIRKIALGLRVRLSGGAARENSGFDVASMGFNALVVFNARELAAVTGDAQLLRRADALADAIDAQWSALLGTWVDVDIATGKPRPSSHIRTLDSLLPLLTTRDPVKRARALAAIADPHLFARPFGLAGTATNDPTYEPNGYWRGDTWPPVAYLIWLGAVRAGDPAARSIGESIVRGATRSQMAEHWNPETGRGLGAIPQGWTPVVGEIQRWLDGPAIGGAAIAG